MTDQTAVDRSIVALHDVAKTFANGTTALPRPIAWTLFRVGVGICGPHERSESPMFRVRLRDVQRGISGGVRHSCRHGPPPHNIKVCILEAGNEDVWGEIICCAGPRPQRGSTTELLEFLATEKRKREGKKTN